jgi:hypothetical protein
MGVGYFGKAHLIWDDGQDKEREIFTALMRNEPIFLYRQGARPSPRVEGYCWRLIAEHPSWRIISWRWELKRVKPIDSFLEKLLTKLLL